MNVIPNADRESLIVEELLTDGWTPRQITSALNRMRKDHVLWKECSYAGCLTLPLFYLARERAEADINWTK
jgi:hypothetical protein